jgi:hypothetical protein
MAAFFLFPMTGDGMGYAKFAFKGCKICIKNTLEMHQFRIYMYFQVLKNWGQFGSGFAVKRN